MRKKLCTRFPAARIKKIMQADEDIGKIQQAVPVLVSKALELFLQDLCDRTYEVTLQRGAKTVNSLHLKHCVKSYSAFDFLTDVVNKVPNLGDMGSYVDDKGISRRRKTSVQDGDGDGETNEELRSPKMPMTSISTRGRGRGRGRGRPSTRTAEREDRYMKLEDDISISPEHEDPLVDAKDSDKSLIEKESIDKCTDPSGSSMNVSAGPAAALNVDGCPPWVSPDISGGIGMGPAGHVNLSVQIDEDEDYDNED